MRKFEPNFRKNPGNPQYKPSAERPQRKREPLTPYEESVRLLASMPGPVVKLMDGESSEQLIRRFRKVVEYSGVLHELKKRESYLSPAQKKKDKKRRAMKKLKKRQKRISPIDEDRK